MINLYYILKFYECGHFCINYLLKKDKIKKKVTYNKQMMSLGLIKRILKQYYARVECYYLEDILQLTNQGRVITLIKTYKNVLHYVVIEKVEKEYIFYYDPLFCFLRKKSKEKFIKKWSKYCCFVSKK